MAWLNSVFVTNVRPIVLSAGCKVKLSRVRCSKITMILVRYPMLRMTHPSRNFFVLYPVCLQG